MAPNKKKSSNSKKKSENSASMTTAGVLEGLQRLATSLQQMDDKRTVTPGHYQEIPMDLQQSYDMMHQGAQLVHSTATKFTLVGKVSVEEQGKIAQDLLKGCQYIATGCLVIENEAYGACRSTRHHTKKAARAVLATVIQLVEAFVQAGKILEKDNNLGAQKCGAVWQTCDVFLQKKLPQGNRNAMRRDLFTWMMECNETMQEFQEMIDQGPNESTAELSFEEFCQAAEDMEQYTAVELEVAKPAVGLVKCSRGAINTTLKACECAGKTIQHFSTSHSGDSNKEKNQAILQWIGQAHDLARHVGEGMTDLGTLLYPTLDLQKVQQQASTQKQLIADLIQFTLDGKAGVGLELEDDVQELAHKIESAAPKRLQELVEAVAAANMSAS